MNKFINIFIILGLAFVCSAQNNSTTTTTAPTSAPTGTVTSSPTSAPTSSPTSSPTSAPTPAPTASPLAATGFVTRTDYQDSACTVQLRTATFAINTCATGYLYPTYYTDGRDSAISISFYNTSGCGSNALVVHSDFQEGECIPGTPLSIKYTYSSSLPTIVSGLYTFTQFQPNATACSGSLLAVTQLQGICFLKPSGNFQSQKITCSGTKSYTTVSCTDTECSQGCVTAVTEVADAGCAANDHDYNSCSAAPGSYPVVPTVAPTQGVSTGETFESGEASGTGTSTETGVNNGNGANNGGDGSNANAGGQQGSSPAPGSGSVHASCAGWGSTLSIVAIMAGAILVLL